MPSPDRGEILRRVPREHPRPRRRQRSETRRRWRALVALTLLTIGVVGVGFGLVARSQAVPEPVQLTPDGTTTVPAVPFFQVPWALYASVDDTRRAPGLGDLGCSPAGTLTLPEQPEDMTTLGSRVIDGEPVDAIVLLGRPGGGASITCAEAEGYDPLWVLPTTQAPALTATSIAIAGVMVAIAGLLALPGVADLPVLWLRRREMRRS